MERLSRLLHAMESDGCAISQGVLRKSANAWVIALTKLCVRLMLCLLFVGTPIAKAQNWNTVHFAGPVNGAGNAVMWSEAEELAYDARVATTPYPYPNCIPSGWPALTGPDVGLV